MPGARRQLCGDQPAVGRHRLVVEAGDVERHRRLDVVPRVAVSAREPRDHAVRALQRDEVAAPTRRPRRRQHAGEIGCLADCCGGGHRGDAVEHEALAEHGREHPLGDPVERGRADDVPLEEAAVAAHQRMVVVVDADGALQPPVRRVQGVGVVARRPRSSPAARSLAFSSVARVDAHVPADARPERGSRRRASS